MEEEVGAPLFRAVITKKSEEPGKVKLCVRYRRKSLFDDKRKEFEVSVEYVSGKYQLQRYLSAKHLKPGDLIYVDGYGEEWTDPTHYGVLRRKWNLMVF